MPALADKLRKGICPTNSTHTDISTSESYLAGVFEFYCAQCPGTEYRIKDGRVESIGIMRNVYTWTDFINSEAK
jgi:hypothetical protein